MGRLDIYRQLLEFYGNKGKDTSPMDAMGWQRQLFNDSLRHFGPWNETSKLLAYVFFCYFWGEVWRIPFMKNTRKLSNMINFMPFQWHMSNPKKFEGVSIVEWTLTLCARVCFTKCPARTTCLTYFNEFRCPTKGWAFYKQNWINTSGFNFWRHCWVSTFLDNKNVFNK